MSGRRQIVFSSSVPRWSSYGHFLVPGVNSWGRPRIHSQVTKSTFSPRKISVHGQPNMFTTSRNTHLFTAKNERSKHFADVEISSLLGPKIPNSAKTPNKRAKKGLFDTAAVDFRPFWCVYWVV